MNWKLIDSRLIVAKEGEYTLKVVFDGKLWLWAVYKNDKEVASVYQHGVPSGEIDARVKAEKAYYKLILDAAPAVIIPIFEIVSEPGGGESGLDASALS